MIDVVCAFLQNQAGEYLLVQRSGKMAHPGTWEFAGGKVKSGENHAQALSRELSEELNISISISGKGNSVEHHYGNKSIRLTPLFCTQTGGRLRLSEHQNFVWLKADAIYQLQDLLAADVALIEQNDL